MKKGVFISLSSLTVLIFLGVIWLYQSNILYSNTDDAFNADSLTQDFQTRLSAHSLAIVAPIPAPSKEQTAVEQLGKKLFFDTRLSANNQVSCSSCHVLAKGGTDLRSKAIGINGQIGNLNSPTVFNAVFNFRQNWDGRSKTLAEQAAGPLFDPIEMGNTEKEDILSFLKEDAYYAVAFKDAFGKDAINLANLTQALEAFQATLVTPNSRFDDYLKGNLQALNTIELEGYQLFTDLGCISCHNGINLGGNMFQTAGIFLPLTDTDSNKWPDRYRITGNELDRNHVKVPTLRNIAATPPYLHDGSAATLEDAIKKMGESQLGIDLTEQQIQKLKLFLHTLTGQYNGQYLSPYH